MTRVGIQDTRSWIRPVVAVPLLFACGVDSDFTVTETDGIEIVESHRPAWGDQAAWSIDPAPRLRIPVWSEPPGGSWDGAEPLTRSDLLLVPYIDLRLPASPATGRHRPSMPVLRYTRAGASIDTLALLPGPEITRLDAGDMRVQMREPFGRPTVLHGGAERFYRGIAERMEIEVYDDAGFLERILRIPDLDLTVPDEEWTAFVEGRARSLAESPPSGAAEVLRALPRPVSRPAYSRFLEDALGHLWVGKHVASFRPGPGVPATTWFVFAPDGRWLGRVEMPAGLHLVEIGADYVLGIQRTAEGTEVRVHDLSR